MRIRSLFAAFAALWFAAAFARPAVVVPTRDIARGTVIAADDLSLQPAPGSVQPGTVTTVADIVGWQARRTLRAGESLRSQDFRRPVLVTKGAIVTMTFDEPGVSLSASMRAISAGGMGEAVTVQNPVSYRLVGAVVTGPGTVRALSGAAVIAPDAARATP
jgi:flagella basal body P-ring formation protein FlgA